jgi:hypothetical protein
MHIYFNWRCAMQSLIINGLMTILFPTVAQECGEDFGKYCDRVIFGQMLIGMISYFFSGVPEAPSCERR